jgi:hypothetical protein
MRLRNIENQNYLTARHAAEEDVVGLERDALL